MPTDAGKRVKRGTSGTRGPNGTASNRAEKRGTSGTKGRTTAAQAAMKRSEGKKAGR